MITPSAIVSPRMSLLLIGLIVAVLATLALGQAAAAQRDDSDNDGLWDHWEERWGVTDPDKRDTDRDGIRDGLEDEDGDRLSNLGEQRFRTDPANPDTDADGTRDGGEDRDGDGVRNALEQDQRPAPANLTPTLSEAFWDVPTSYSNGCHTDAFSAIIHPCLYGDETGDVKVAIFGDSHALQWLPALDKAGSRQGWAVTTLTKTACPSVDVKFSGAAFEGTEKPCRRWRAAALEWLRNNRQDIVIITNSGRYPLVDAAGERVYAPNKEPRWQAGLARTLEALPRQSQAVVMADTPNLRANPVSCLKQEWADLADCVTRRAATRVPEHEVAEQETAAASGAHYDDLNSVVCPYDPCPIVSGNTLMWRNESHLTATYAEQLAPAMRGLVERALQAAGDVSGDDARRVTIEIVAFDDRLEPAAFEVSAGDELIVTVRNEGREKHSISFYESLDGPPLDEAAVGPVIEPGQTATMLMVTPGAGTYIFVDDDDPERLVGSLVVTEGGG